MKSLILALAFCFASSVASAQVYSTSYNKYSVMGAVGSALDRKPFEPQFNAAVGFGYKFAANYDKLFDSVYAGASYTPKGSDVAVGIQRTMMNDRDRLGLIWVNEVGAARFAHTGVIKPEVASGLGLAMNVSGDPYPHWLNNTVVFFLPKINYVFGQPIGFSLKIGFARTFGKKS